MEKLAGTSSPKPASPAPEANTQAPSNATPKISQNEESKPKPKININKAAPTPAAENPFAQLTSKSTSDNSNVRIGDSSLLRTSKG